MDQRPAQQKKVYFYTGSFTHTFYKEQFLCPPAGFEYLPSSAELLNLHGIRKDIIQSRHRLYPYKQYLSQVVLGLLISLRIPKIRRVSSPECDLIHSAQYPLLNRQPWVIDFEDVSAFTWYSPKVLRSPLARKILENIFASPSCQAILPWTEAARKSLENALDCQKFREKIKVVYPTITPQKKDEVEKYFAARQSAKKIKLLFVGTAFLMKGGLETLIVLDRLSKRYEVEGAIVSNVPAEYAEKYKGHPAIRFYSKVSNEELKKLYQTSHLFLAPYHTDTFGFVILEAFSYGLPCLGTDQFAIPEIVTDGQTGRVVTNSASRFNQRFLPVCEPIIKEGSPLLEMVKNPPSDYLERLETALESLIKDRQVLEKMGRNAYAEVVSGRFSAREHQNSLMPIYQQATSGMRQKNG